MENKVKPGPKTGIKTVKATVLIEPDMRDWGTSQPGGLSVLMRRLLKQEKEKADKDTAKR